MDADELIGVINRVLMFLTGILGNNLLAIRSLPQTDMRSALMRSSSSTWLSPTSSPYTWWTCQDFPRWWENPGKSLCDVFHFCAGPSASSSIDTTFFISAFCHQQLVGSPKRGGASVQLDSLCLVTCLLAGSWIVVYSIVPHFFFVTVNETNESHDDSMDVFPNALARQTYEIFNLTLGNALPVAGIVFASVQIVITLLQNRRCIRGHNSDTTKEMVKR